MEGLALIVGLALGFSIGSMLRAKWVLRALKEYEIIAEIKRRRVEARLTQEAESSVAKDLEGL